MKVEDVISMLSLKPHPAEGGFFTETYRSDATLAPGVLPGLAHGSRSLSTAIYYLMTPEAFSALHRLRADEVFHFYLGDPVEMLQLKPDGKGSVLRLGHDLAQGMRPQVLVPREVWQGSRLVPGGRFALLGTTMAPGFAYQDYEPGDRAALLSAYPSFRDLILDLTR